MVNKCLLNQGMNSKTLYNARDEKLMSYLKNSMINILEAEHQC